MKPPPIMPTLRRCMGNIPVRKWVAAKVLTRSHLVPQPCHARACALGRIRPCVELNGDPPIKAAFAQEMQGRQKIEVAAINRREGERVALPAFEMDVAHTIVVLSDQRRGIAAGRGEMCGVRAEADAGLGEDAPNLLGRFGHGREMWMIKSA